MSNVNKEKILSLILCGSKKDIDKDIFKKASFDCVAYIEENEKFKNIKEVETFLENLNESNIAIISDFINSYDEKLFKEFRDYLIEKGFKPTIATSFIFNTKL